MTLLRTLRTLTVGAAVATAPVAV
ncbi:MAG: hypothetical protein RJA51_1554, partial [Actinomycetota bacterium]